MKKMGPLSRIVTFALLAAAPAQVGRAASLPATSARLLAQDTIETPTAEIYDRALRQYRNRDWQQALDTLNQVLATDPDRAEVHYLVGYCHLMLREYEQSVEAFGRAFAIEPELDPRRIYGR